jgi:hypothetical protein
MPRSIVASNGQSEARAYLVVDVPPPGPEPALALERVQILDPRQTSTLVNGAVRAGSGPRNPEQRDVSLPKPPGVELPDGLPATKAQRIFLDPEVVARWRAEAAEEARTKGGG